MKRVLYILICFAVFYNTTKAQVILPLGLGQVNSTNITCSSKDNLWVLSSVGQKLSVEKWEGNFWIPMSDIPGNLLAKVSTQVSNIKALGIYSFNNELLVALANMSSNQLFLFKLSGRNWSEINTDNVLFEKELEFIETDNDLLIGGKLKVNGTSVSIIKIENSSISIYAYSPAAQDINDYYSDFEYCGGKIWAIGLFTSYLDPNKRYFSYFENNVWKIVDNPPGLFGFERLGKFKDRVIIVSKGSNGNLSFASQSINQSIWDNISDQLNDWDIQEVSDMRQIGNNLWVSGKFYHGTSNKTLSLIYWNGKTWDFPDFDFLGSDVKINGTTQVYVSGSFLNHQGLILNKVGILDFGSAVIAGKVFYDLNQNCSQDYAELPASGMVLKLSPENIYFVTDYNGHYVLPVDSTVKVHGIELIVPKHYRSTCESFKGTKHSQQLTISGVDFGLMPSGNNLDAAVQINDYTGWRARQGFDEKYRICVQNKGVQPLTTGLLEVNVDERLTNWNFSEVPDLQMSNMIKWTIPSLKMGESYCIDAVATIPLSIPLKENIEFHANVYTTDVEDFDISDNKCKLTQSIVAAIDPNDKASNRPFFIAPGTPSLEYKIRFQNTGTDTAYDVIVTDTIDPNLYFLNDQFFNPVSHENNLKFVPKYWTTSDGKYHYKFAWRFINILLPDSGTNYDMSQGFIQYKLGLLPDTKIGTIIRNRAFIYFDYQEPILTNIALNMVSLNTGMVKNDKLKVLEAYPNPTKDIITIKNNSKEEMNVVIFNTMGQQLLDYKVSRESFKSIPLSEFSSGVYLIKAEGYSPLRVIVK